MLAALIVLHVLVCIALIIVVLLQSGKGAEIGASFGAGASQTVFGATGGKSFMSRMTTSVAVIFMLTSLTLAYFYGKPSTTSVMPSQVPSATAPAQKAPAATPPATQAPAKQAAPAEGAKK